MLKFLNLQPEIFGLDINDLSLRLVKLKKRKQGFSVASFNEIEIKKGIVKEGVIQDQESLAVAIREVYKGVNGKKLSTPYVVASLPEEKSFSQIIQMPNMTEKELEGALLFEVENYIPLPIDKVYFDFQIVGSSKNDKGSLDVLINVMPKNVVDSYVSSLKKAGLVPYALEVGSQAIIGSVIQKSNTSPCIIIDFGETKTNFMVYSYSSLRFTSSIPFCSSQLTTAIKDSLGFTFSQAERIKIKYGLSEQGEKKYNIKKAMSPMLNEFISEIKKYMDFYQSHFSNKEQALDGKFAKLLLCGGGSNLKELPEFLSKHLKLPVEIANPFVNFSGNSKQSHNIPSQKILSFTTALGLAMRETDEN